MKPTELSMNIYNRSSNHSLSPSSSSCSGLKRNKTAQPYYPTIDPDLVQMIMQYV